MSVAVITDAHLGAPGDCGDRTAVLVEQLDELPGSGCRRLVLLGDIFHVWVAERQFETPEVRQVVAALTRLREHGVRLEYVEGNRDYYVASGAYARLFDAVVDEVSFEAAGVRYLAVHGHCINYLDRRLRLWRWFAQSAPVHLVVRALPSRLGQRLVRATDRGMEGRNIRFKIEIPREMVRAYAERRLAEGHDVLLVGHFHEPHRWTVSGGEVRLLDAWCNSARVERFGAVSAGES